MLSAIEGLEAWVEKFKALRANPTVEVIGNIISEVLELSEGRYAKDESGNATDSAVNATDLYSALGADYIVRNAEEMFTDNTLGKGVRIAALEMLMNVPDAEERAFIAAVGMLVDPIKSDAEGYRVDPDFYDALAYGLSHPLWDRRRDSNEYGEPEKIVRMLKDIWDHYPEMQGVLIRPFLRFDPYCGTTPELLDQAWETKDEMVLAEFCGSLLYRSEWVGGYYLDMLEKIAESNLMCAGDALEALAAHYERVYKDDQGDKGRLARLLSLAVFWGDIKDIEEFQVI